MSVVIHHTLSRRFVPCYTMSSEAASTCIPKNLVLHVIDASFLVAILVVQGSILNYYIISRFSHSVNPYFWFIADFSCLFVFAGALTISYQYLNKDPEEQSAARRTRLNPIWGALPLSYLSWLLYSGILLGKIVMIFKSDIPDNLSPDKLLGTQFLQGTIAVSGLVFLLLAEGHDGSKHNSPRHLYVTSVCAKTGIELLDVVTFLSLLLVNETRMTLTFGLENTILVLVCIDLLLPGLALYKLSLLDVAQERFWLPTVVLYNILHLLLIDLPFLGVRVYLWIYYGNSASIFVMKNIFRIVSSLRGMYPDLSELARNCRVNRNKAIMGNGVPGSGDDTLALQPIIRKTEGEEQRV